MKPIRVDTEVITSHSHEVVDMSLDQDSLVHLMNQFIDLYKDALTAILREYGTNAWDSHQEAGISDPIEVQLPDQWDPILRIKDHGIGLSKQELIDIYSKYGASTKRESNEVVGMLGLGCKSGLTYAQQFTILANKDGMRTTVLVSRNELGAGSLHFMDHSPTELPNGVEIAIPIRKEDHKAVETKAAAFFQYWPEGSVLINGEAPTSVKAERLVGEIYLRPGVSQSYVVMGNTPYPVSPEELGLDLTVDNEGGRHWDRQSYSSALLAYLPIGSVEPHQSREFLRQTDENKAALADIAKQFIENVGKRAFDDIDAAPTRREAVIRMSRWRYQIPRSAIPYIADSHGHKITNWTYRGERIPEEFRGEIDYVEETRGRNSRTVMRGFLVAPRTKKSGTSNLVDRKEAVPATVAVNSVWLYGFELQSFTAKHREKLDKWVENRGLDGHTNFIFTRCHPEQLDCYPWINQDWVFDFEEVRSTKLPKQASNANAVGFYSAFNCSAKREPKWFETREICADSIDADKPVFYFVGPAGKQTKRRYWSHYNDGSSRPEQAEKWAKAIWALVPDCTILMIPQNREAKLLREFPNARRIEQALRAKFNRWKGQLTSDQKRALGMHEANERNLFRLLDPSKIDDPEIVDAIRLAKVDIKASHQRLKVFTGALSSEVTAMPWKDPLDQYHLKLTDDRSPSKAMLEHYYIYLNGVYAINNQEAQLHAA